jgi:hypothetical protein
MRPTAFATSDMSCSPFIVVFGKLVSGKYERHIRKRGAQFEIVDIPSFAGGKHYVKFLLIHESGVLVRVVFFMYHPEGMARSTHSRKPAARFTAAACDRLLDGILTLAHGTSPLPALLSSIMYFRNRRVLQTIHFGRFKLAMCAELAGAFDSPLQHKQLVCRFIDSHPELARNKKEILAAVGPFRSCNPYPLTDLRIKQFFRAATRQYGVVLGTYIEASYRKRASPKAIRRHEISVAKLKIYNNGGIRLKEKAILAVEEAEAEADKLRKRYKLF